ncbi:serine/threonine protein kinase, partial [Rubripirellula sp.]
MPRDDDQSLGHEATLQGGKPAPAGERSLGDRSTFGGGDGSSLSDLSEFAELPDHDMEIVDVSSRYTIEKSLGKGGMGEVLLATDTRLDRKVAIKRIRGDAGSSKAAVARFLTEAKSVAALNHHNIVQIHDYGRDEEGPFLIMEFVPGGTLLDRCKQGPLELDEAIDLACQLCDGLGRAHDAGIIHRDIKPANILLTDDGVPKLTDFGLAKADSRDHTMTMTGAVLGTLDFMPPEQRQDASLVDARSDLWSLGATLYQMVTGKSPKIIRFDSLPPSLTSVLGQALEENKEDRYQKSTELRAALIASKTSSELAAPMIQDLGAGECPVCHTLNESSRKFCRECAAPLLVPCLQCSEPMAIWDKVCGECGGKQQELLEERKAEHASQREEAEQLRADYQFSEAIDLLKPMQLLEDRRFNEISEWAKNYGSEIEEEAERRPREAQELFTESQKHSKAFDYAAAISIMQQIPALWLTTDMVQHQRDVEAAELESASVLAQIKQAIKSNELHDLLPLIERGIELRGDRKDLPKLLQKIDKQQQQKASALVEAKTFVDSQKYEQALGVLSQVPEKLADNEVRRLIENTTVMLQELRSIEAAIISKESDPNTELIELIYLLQSYLNLKRGDSARERQLNDLIAKRDKLITQEQKILVEANDLFKKQYYTRAIRKIDDTKFAVLASRAEACRKRYATQLSRGE